MFLQKIWGGQKGGQFFLQKLKLNGFRGLLTNRTDVYCQFLKLEEILFK